MDKVKLGKRLKEARLAKHYTQELLAEKASITIVYLSELERGVKLPSLTKFVELAQLLDVSTDYLLRDDLDAGKSHVYDDITKKLEPLTPKQRVACAELIDTYIRNL